MLNHEQIQLITEISNGDISNIDTRCGICGNVRRLARLAESHVSVCNYLSQFWVNWPEYSGQWQFPISGAADYYGQNLWEGEQLRLRISLCKFLLTCI